MDIGRQAGYDMDMPQTKMRPRKTVDDFMKLPEGTRAELIEGEIYHMSPSPKERHQRIVALLTHYLMDFAEGNGLGRVYVAPFDVHLPSGDIVEPDLIFVAAANRRMIRDWIYGAPDLLIEVLSPDGLERDRLVKRDLYARNGVKEYWLVDGVNRSIEVLRLSGTRYKPHGYFREKETLTSPALAGLKLPLRKIFE